MSQEMTLLKIKIRWVYGKPSQSGVTQVHEDRKFGKRR